MGTCDHLAEVQKARKGRHKEVKKEHKVNSDLNAARNIAFRALSIEGS
ncbi:MAG: hypothetical protein ACTSR8_18470 [Promethearchaeota archaeon]